MTCVNEKWLKSLTKKQKSIIFGSHVLTCSEKERKKFGSPKDKHHNWIGGKPKCLDCNKLLSRYDAKRCRKCSKQGKLHSNYIDGRSWIKYPKEFNSLLKNKIIIRDRSFCQKCQMSRERHFSVFNRDITVHHIDYNRHNCNDNNLITLCLSCNVKANKNRIKWETFFKRKING